MLSRSAFNIVKKPIYNYMRILYPTRYLQSSFIACDSNMKQRSIRDQFSLHTMKRFKSSRKKAADNKKHMDEDSEDEEMKENELPVGSKMITVNVQTLRLDAISKVGFGISRNKVEEAFYASKIRVNGKKVFKKSVTLNEGDEIDMILHRDVDNPAFLVINRIVLLSISSTSNDNIRINMSRDRNLLIEDYEESWSSD